jgi:hypothetical protein
MTTQFEFTQFLLDSVTDSVELWVMDRLNQAQLITRSSEQGQEVLVVIHDVVGSGTSKAEEFRQLFGLEPINNI